MQLQWLAGRTDNSIKPYIPRVWRYFLDFLAVKCSAEQFRSQPVLTMLKKRETAIIVTAAHSNSMPLVVECDERSHNEIQVARFDRRACHRLPDSKRTALQQRIGPQISEEQYAVSGDDRAKNALICAPRARNDASRVNLIAHWQIACNRPSGSKFVTMNKIFGDSA